MRIPLCEAKYIQEARAVFAVKFPDGNFDDVSWGVKHLIKSQHEVSRARVYFTIWDSEVEPLPARFVNIVKASVLLMGASVGTLQPRIAAARILWIAVEKRLGKSGFTWSKVCEEDLLNAEQQMLLHCVASTTYGRCGLLRQMIDTLAVAPYGPIVRPLKIVFRTPRQESFDRYTLEGQELRLAKMPSDAMILALGEMFCRAGIDSCGRLYFCVLAILLASGLRIGEVLTLPLDCEVTEGEGANLRHGLRYTKEKKFEVSVFWFSPLQYELAKAAITEVKLLTESARNRARMLERNPNTLPLPGISPDALLTRAQILDLLGLKPGNSEIFRSKALRNRSDRSTARRFLYPASAVIAYLISVRRPLWIVERPDGTQQSLSESLFIQFRNAGSDNKGTSPWVVEGVLARSINDFLGSSGRDGTKSVFERYDVRDSTGKFYSMNSQQFRHWMTTKTAKAGILDPVIARWQGREHVVEVGTYKHLTREERLETLKAALKSGCVKGSIAEHYFSLKEDVRDMFIAGQVQAVQVPGIGLCVHNFFVTPCPKLLVCVKDCDDDVLDTATKSHIHKSCPTAIANGANPRSSVAAASQRRRGSV